jgi:peptidoglycan/LPS O-acetylase OafA/YrhL
MSNPALSKRRKAALACYLAVDLGFVAMGLVYLFSPRFMPYHAHVVGMQWPQVPEGFQRLLLTFQRGSGAAALACALAFAILVLVPLRRGDAWARRAVPAVGLTGVLPTTALVAGLGASTGAPVPLAPLLAAIGLLVAGWLLSLEPRR